MEGHGREWNNDRGRGRGRGDRRGGARWRGNWRGNGERPMGLRAEANRFQNHRQNMQEPVAGDNNEDVPRQQREYDEHHGNLVGGNHRGDILRQQHHGEERGNVAGGNPRRGFGRPAQGQQRVPLAGRNPEDIHQYHRGGAQNEPQPNAIPARPNARPAAADQTRQHGRRLRHQDLVEMTTLDAEELLGRMNIRNNGFYDALNDEKLLQRPDSVSEMITCINRALQCESGNRAAKLQLLNNIRTSTLLSQHISFYFTKMMTESSNAKLRSYKQPIKNSLEIFRQLMLQFPGSFGQIQVAFGTITMVANDLRTRSNVIDADTDESLSQTQQMLHDLLEIQRANNQERNGTQDSRDGSVGSHKKRPPPNNFREMSVFPDMQSDIHNRAEPFLRENITKGSFDTVEDYLDIQFRLLREDFIRPLREGIREYMAFHVGDVVDRAAGQRPRRLTNIRVYHNVCVLNPVCTPGGIHYRVRFDISRLRHINWHYSKRLIFGSLVCLSSDDFITVRLATVTNRSADKLKDGELEIHFEGNEDDENGNDVHDIKPDEHFVMIETSGYFEAYRHVLTALKETQQEDIPFQENIVNCEKEVPPPQYLLTAEEPCFDLRAIAGRKRVTVDLDDSDDDETDDGGMLGGAHLTSVNILKPDCWPAAATLHLDDSQLKALKTALTRRVAIIQGPPGTGKTYIGLKIVQTLLDNRQRWNRIDPEENSPILVVCYTNHALDQFLEGMCHFVKRGIVRVGGRSKSKKMEEFLLKEQRKKLRDSREVPRRIFLGRINAYLELEGHKAQIEHRNALIEGAERGLLHEKILHEFMLEDHYENLVSRIFADELMNQSWLMKGKKSGHGPSVLPMWLELVDFFQADENDQSQEQQLNADGILEQEHAEEDFDDEARAEEEERRLEVADDIDDDEANDRRLQEENRRQRNIQRADELLAVNFDDIHNRDAHVAADGEVWRQQRPNRKKRMQRLCRRLKSTIMMTREEVDQVIDLWNLTVDDRWKLYRFWINEYITDIRRNMVDAERDFQIAANNLKEILEEEDMVVMRKMKVIGMTTTGAARYINTLRRIQPKIIVVEEAAEVLEAHVIATLSRSCEHLILIGDHQQLRPNPQVHQLAEDYNLKYSLFERLVINEMDHETLSKQHRMRPEIAEIMRVFYQKLTDDESVMKYDNVKGVAKNMYFVTHCHEEHMDDELRSVSNEHEAQFIIALGNYFIQQGYSPSQITILTPYVGQVFMLRRLLREMLPMMKGVHICPIDNYQGEENEIVLLSLVRSNDGKKIGFLKEDNRICVALSRAKQGFYVIGNFSQLVQCSETWSKIIAKAKEKEAYGPSLRLCCQNHPDQAQIDVRTRADFNKAPEGGCMRECGYRLECGHACDRVCHPYDQSHKQYTCPKPCQKKCEHGHRCHRKCFQSCGPCQQMVQKRLVRCGHQQMVPCSMEVDDITCSEQCHRQLSCGHRCQNLCGEECTTECNYASFKKCSLGHRFMIKCFQKTQVTLCKEPCGILLDCQHPCPGNCGTCFSGRLHSACTAPCGRTLVCGHQCDVPCTKNCPPCRSPCQNRCNHSRCPRDCGQPCEPCREPCLWQCQHYQCTKLCYEPCDRPRCDQPCTKQLSCGHPCIGMCGETCPSKCRVCHREEVTDILFGTEDEPDARFVQLEDCDHVFEVTALDEYMNKADDQSASTAIQLKTCPRCRVAIRRNLRYGTSINSVLHDIEVVKSRMIGDANMNKTKITQLSRLLGTLKLKEESVNFFEERLKIFGLSEEELVCIENIVKFTEHIMKLQRSIQEKIRDKVLKVSIDIQRGYLMLHKEAEHLKAWLLEKRTRLSGQQLFESKMEIARIDICFMYYQIDAKIRSAEHANLTADKKDTFNKMLKTLTDQKMTEDLQKKAEEVMKSTQKCLSGIGVSDAEHLEIVSAMGMSAGHWFKCPNGHFYAIGDCGGATVESKCGECKAPIGGTSHALRSDNRFAPEIDGAVRTAWPGTTMGMNANI